MRRSALATMLVLAVGLLGALGSGVAPRVARAQSGIMIVSEQPRNEFPRGVTFTLSFTAPAAPKEVRIQYHLAPDGTGATAIADCNDAATVSCTYTLTSGAGIFIIPGAEITYHWEITDAAGEKTSTPDNVYVHADTRFTFQTLQQDNITLYYHSGTQQAAQAVLDATAATLRDVGALEKTQVTFPIKVFLYATADEMQPAIAPGEQGRGVQVLGEVVYSDTAMVSADVDTLDIARHEVAHIVTREATKGPFGIAAWMNEGISVFSQTKPLAGHESALQTAIRADRVLSIKELNSSASGSVASTVGLYYGQAGSMIKYLVDTYGPDKFAELLKTFKDGSTPDKAFESVYGFDQLGYENAWRQSVGLEARTASPTATPQATEEARTAPTSSAKSTPAASSRTTGSDDGAPVVTIAIIIALAAALLAAVVGAGMVVWRRM
jgi:hypothetical protein